MLQNLYTYRRYIWDTAWSELRYRYAGTGLGIYWNIINPLLGVLVYGIVFTRILIIEPESQQNAPFVLYLIVGLFPWLYFTETIFSGSNAFLQNASFLKRLALPVEIFVAKTVLTATFSHLIILILLLWPVSIGLGESPSWLWLGALPVILLLQVFAFGLALILATLRVFFRDIGEILRTLLQLWQWTMPIVYPETLLPAALQRWLVFNPPYIFIQSIRGSMLDQQLPSAFAWALMLFWAGLFGLAGAVTLAYLQPEIKDNL